MLFAPAQLNRRAELYHQMGSMIKAGVPLIRSLEMAGNNASLRGSRKAISGLVGHLNNGLSFSDSMTRVHGWMPKFDVALLSAGEQSGRLDQSFKLLGTHYATRATILSDTINQLIVPMVNLHVLLLVFPLSVLIKFVMGIMNNDYSQIVPFIVEKILAYGILWGVILISIFICQGNRGERWRSFLESVSQIIPLLGKAVKFLSLARLTAALEALISAGVSIVKAWPMAVAGSGSSRLKREVSTWDSELEHGSTPAELVNRANYFPEMFKNLYHSGEISGKLDESLLRLHTYFQEEGFRTLRLFTRFATFSTYFTIAIIIAYNVVKFYMGYFSQAVSGF